MVRIAPVNLPYNPKTLWFDAGELEISAGDDVVVETARGTEFGHVSDNAFEATPEQVKKLKSPLKPVVRVADDEDRARAAELEEKAAEALPVFKELAAKASEEMRPVSVEYLFDGDKAVFYFESENRVDFRELVRTLSSRLHVRVDMRQIGVRDEARMVGGLGHCGQELCCKRLGGEFCPVSIRMAKEQDLSLNPQKISGVCGRLMCCLRYEYDAYKDFKSRAPKKNAQVETPDGPAKVVDLDVPREVVSLRVEGEKPVRVPLADFEPAEEGARPKCVGCDAWERANSAQTADVFGAAASLATPQLSGKDQLADHTSVCHVPGGKKRDQKQETERAGKGSSRRNRGRGKERERASEQETAQAAPTRKPRRRRSTKVTGGAAEAAERQVARDQQSAAPERAAEGKQAQGAPKSKDGQAKRRGMQPSKRRGQSGGKPEQPQKGQRGSEQRERGGKGGEKQQAKQQRKPAEQGKPRVRPGQKSSALSQNRPEGQAGPRHARSDQPQQSGAASGQHRRARRRSHKAAGTGEGAQTPQNGN